MLTTSKSRAVANWVRTANSSFALEWREPSANPIPRAIDALTAREELRGANRPFTWMSLLLDKNGLV